LAASGQTSNSGAALSWENSGSQSGTGTTLNYGDANKIFPLTTATIASTGSGGILALVAIKPFTTATLGVVNATASNTAAASPDNFSGYRSSSFLGFAVASASPGGSINVVVGGIASSLSGLTAGLQYFLSNTTGAIVNVAGAVTRKAAIAISTTQVLITNIW
jgi:hypothetical protein